MSNAGHSDPLEAGKGEHIYLSVQQMLKILCELDEFETDRTLKFYNNINIACLFGCSLGLGAKDSHLLDTILGSKVRIVLSKQFHNLFFR